MALSVISAATLSLATVDSTSNALRATLYNPDGPLTHVYKGDPIIGNPDGIPVSGFNDGAWRSHRMDRFGCIRFGFDQVAFRDFQEGTVINTQVWSQSSSGFTQAQSATAGISLNSTAATTANSYSILTSQKQFMKMQQMPLRLRFRIKANSVSNGFNEFGFGNPTTNTAQIAVGAYWRLNGGSVIPVLSFNGADVVTGSNISSSLTLTNYYNFGIIVEDGTVMFVVQDSSTGQSISEQYLNIPLTQAKMWSATHLPIFLRSYNNATGGSAPSITVSDTLLMKYDTYLNKSIGNTMALIGGGQEYLPGAYTQSSQWANSAAPTQVTPTATTPGYTGSLGGLYRVTHTVNATTSVFADANLFSFQVPTGYTFYCTGITISGYAEGAWTTAALPTLNWQVSGNASSSDLSAASSQLPINIGSQSYPTTVVAGNLPTVQFLGTSNGEVSWTTDTPLRTEGGRYLNIFYRFICNNTTAGAFTYPIAGTVLVKGYFE